MDRGKAGKIVLAVFLGYLVGAAVGFLIDRPLGGPFFSAYLLQEPLRLELYLIKVEVQVTPASLIGLVATLFFVLKKG
ncbi:hypothetical protein EHQ27_02065 [Leptospira wolffii]|nr:hypothetical protein LEP1GSC061_1328 [Leptospira wolffii serovar Khorat str. Khorat-H2]PJZ65660.1 hypothetical protein CH371_12080 [Leptospira wolffii]TGK56127.1 hypothetical protein EHQ32_17085 [Leptospira wolffii]TGK72173.1 hypothetical protein EHQ35_12520 [Leptospira wolffii]TGK77477.1 hypothetical protein EHQ27_02065 [Leptospira wolffii]